MFFVSFSVPPVSITMDGMIDDSIAWIKEALPANINCSVPAIKPNSTIFWKVNGTLLSSQPTTYNKLQPDTSFTLTSTLHDSFVRGREMEITCYVADKQDDIPMKTVSKTFQIYCKYDHDKL